VRPLAAFGVARHQKHTSGSWASSMMKRGVCRPCTEPRVSLRMPRNVNTPGILSAAQHRNRGAWPLTGTSARHPACRLTDGTRWVWQPCLTTGLSSVACIRSCQERGLSIKQNPTSFHYRKCRTGVFAHLHRSRSPPPPSTAPSRAGSAPAAPPSPPAAGREAQS